MRPRTRWTIAAAAAAVLAFPAPSSASAALPLAKVGAFSDPTFVTAPPGDPHRLFVVEKGGSIRLVRDGVIQSTAFLDLSSSLDSDHEGGLLSIAFAPEYATSGRFYVYYTAARSGDPAGAVIPIASL